MFVRFFWQIVLYIWRMQCLSLEYTSHLFLSKRKTRLRDQDNTWTNAAPQCWGCTLVWKLWRLTYYEALCAQTQAVSPSPASSWIRARTVFCFVMSGHGPVLSPEAGGQSVTRSRPRRICEARARVSCCCLEWPHVRGLFRAGIEKWK